MRLTVEQLLRTASTLEHALLALQQQRGVNLTDAAASVRTACLTGVAQRKMVEPIDAPSGGNLVLTAGDFEEMRAVGSYEFYRLEIAADGRWLPLS